MRDLQIMAVCTFDFSSNSLLSFYVKSNDHTFYIRQILESSIQKNNLGPCSLDVQGIAWELYTQHCVCGQTKLASVEALWLAYRLLFLVFFLLLFIWVLWFPSTYQQLHTFLTTPGKLQPESGPLPVKHVCKHLILDNCENSQTKKFRI